MFLTELFTDRALGMKGAIDKAKQLAKTEGILAGISSGCALWATTKLAALDEYKGKTIVALLYDTGE